jgi:hypothetical protein
MQDQLHRKRHSQTKVDAVGVLILVFSSFHSKASGKKKGYAICNKKFLHNFYMTLSLIIEEHKPVLYNDKI